VDTVTSLADSKRLYQYNQFSPNTLGMGLEAGVQYHQLFSWVDASFTPTQVSSVPGALKSDGDLHDVKWFRYGFEWMFGWGVLPENAKLNLIPSVGAGFSLLNMHFASNYQLVDNDGLGLYTLSNRYYSTFGKSVKAQLELRFALSDRLSVGGIVGAQAIWYDNISLETVGATNYSVNYGEMSGNSWYVGGKVTWTLPSVTETRLKETL